MKILLVNKFHYLKGGSEKYYFTLAEGFKKLGHEVIFFAMKDKNNIECEQEEYFVNNASMNGGIKSKITMLMHIAYSKEAYRHMKRLLKDEKPDLVILNLVHKQITCSVIDAIKEYNPNLPIYWTMHDLICVCPSFTMLDGEDKICEKCLDGNFNHCIENKCIHGSTLMSRLSTYEANQIKKYGWYDKVDLFICPSEFYQKKLESAKFTTSKIICLRNPLPINTQFEVNSDTEDYVLYFGRISKEKGIKTLIDAIKNINYRLVVLGTGPLEYELKQYLEVNDIKNVEFKGFKQGEELTNFIKKARCVVLPSEWYENGPYSAMEAMALGKPLIVSSLGGLPELVINDKNGYIYKDKEELICCLNKIINLDEIKYKEMSINSMNMAKEMFDCQKYIESLLSINGGK